MNPDLREMAADSVASSDTLASPEIPVQTRPTRWHYPFSSEMSDQDINRLLEIEPFSKMDQQRFREPVSLAAILRNDTRLVRCKEGQVLFREGEWGNSAFLVLSGFVRVDLNGPDGGLPVSSSSTVRPSAWTTLARLWGQHQPQPPRFGVQPNHDDDSSFFIQDMPAAIAQGKTASLHPGQLFGEVAALGRIPRTATIFAEVEAELLEISKNNCADRHGRGTQQTSHCRRPVTARKTFPATAQVVARWLEPVIPPDWSLEAESAPAQHPTAA